ncbi:hypothetical protein EVAR_94363_1 [Eumeta japonica]|uniref:Uncharacterized protein n=1 Tax=Eumeta variegata TaxID=151549 RepID=A0A4C1TPX5_EUMVA|nr:hypothetical protein EVAR_94363_1 [Eumeta japonica]
MYRALPRGEHVITPSRRPPRAPRRAAGPIPNAHTRNFSARQFEFSEIRSRNQRGGLYFVSARGAGRFFGASLPPPRPGPRRSQETRQRPPLASRHVGVFPVRNSDISGKNRAPDIRACTP